MEDRIRQLCRQLAGEKDPRRAVELTRQLGVELNRFTHGLRTKAAWYHITLERRVDHLPTSDSLQLEAV